MVFWLKMWKVRWVGGRMAEKSAKKKMEDRKGVEGEVRS
jgi:hypothetical protein